RRGRALPRPRHASLRRLRGRHAREVCGRLRGRPLMADLPAVPSADAPRPSPAEPIRESTVHESTYVDAIRDALAEAMERDSPVLVLGEDGGVYGGAFRATDGLLQRFGESRVIDTPLSEEAIVGAAIGAAMRGLRPVAEMQFIDFVSRAFD